MSRRRKKKLLELNIEKYAAQGKSIGYHEGKVVFVAAAIPGDLVKVKIVKNKKDYAEGKLLQVIKPSPYRQDADCQHFGSCGGCQWQMLDYQLQTKYKYAQVQEQMRNISQNNDIQVLDILSAHHPFRYRNKVEFSFSNKKYLKPEELNDENLSNSRNVLGFHAKGLFDKVVEIEDCKIQPKEGNIIRNAVHRYAQDHDLEYYDLRENKGFLRGLQIRQSTEGQIMVNLIARSGRDGEIKGILDFLRSEFDYIHSYYYTINDKLNDSLYDLEPSLYQGEAFIRERLGDFIFHISPLSFFQTNTAQAETLYAAAKKMLNLEGDEVLYDLYCGTGSIGIYMSDSLRQVIGVETVAQAVEDAHSNAQLNNVQDKCQFFVGDVDDVCHPKFFEEHPAPDIIVVDPPRMGLTPKIIDSLLQVSAPKLLYISCNPSTQARDLEKLEEKYQVLKLQPVDLFPHTYHIENIALLQLKTP